jgi:hypothetical protein
LGGFAITNLEDQSFPSGIDPQFFDSIALFLRARYQALIIQSSK